MKGDRIATLDGIRGIVEEDYDPVRDEGLAKIYFGTADNRRVVRWVPVAHIIVNPTAEFPHTKEEPRADRQQILRVQEGRDGEVDVEQPKPRVAFPRPRRSGDS